MKKIDACPKCGSENQIDWGTFEMCDGHCGYYAVTCGYCGFEGRQWQMMKFDGWEEYGDDGLYTEIDEWVE